MLFPQELVLSLFPSHSTLSSNFLYSLNIDYHSFAGYAQFIFSSHSSCLDPRPLFMSLVKTSTCYFPDTAHTVCPIMKTHDPSPKISPLLQHSWLSKLLHHVVNSSYRKTRNHFDLSFCKTYIPSSAKWTLLQFIVVFIVKSINIL